MLDEGSRDPLIAEPVMSGLPNPNLKLYRRLLARGIPILFFNSFYENLDIPHISMNDVQAGRAATEYLIEKVTPGSEEFLKQTTVREEDAISAI